jgi:hypothetical protein
MNIEGKEERCWGGNTPQQIAQSEKDHRRNPEITHYAHFMKNTR